MKIKVLVPICFSIIIGFLFGQIIFSEYNNTAINVFEEKEKIYFVELDTFKNKDEITFFNDNNYLIIEEDNVYKVYGGITKDVKIAKKIKEYYSNLDNNIYVREKVVSNETFLNLLSEYDKITLIANKDEDIINIEKIVMSNYKEIVVNGNDN